MRQGHELRTPSFSSMRASTSQVKRNEDAGKMLRASESCTNIATQTAQDKKYQGISFFAFFWQYAFFAFFWWYIQTVCVLSHVLTTYRSAWLHDRLQVTPSEPMRSFQEKVDKVGQSHFFAFFQKLISFGPSTMTAHQRKLVHGGNPTKLMPASVPGTVGFWWYMH